MAVIVDCAPKNYVKSRNFEYNNNGDSETRTRDLYVANVSLSQLSYIPMHENNYSTSEHKCNYLLLLILWQDAVRYFFQ